jgi:hypothetical protein
MVRAQIQLTEDQFRRLKRWSEREGISLSEAVRRCIEDHLAHEESMPNYEERTRAALSVAGKYEDPDGLTDVGENHDRYLEDARSH